MWSDVKRWLATYGGSSRGGPTTKNPQNHPRRVFDPLNAGLDGAFAHIIGSEVAKRRVLVLADPSCQVHDHVSWLDRVTLGVVMCNSLSNVHNRTAQFAEDTVLLIGIDYFVDLEAAIDALALFRITVPSQPIVMASRSFGRLDLSCERAMIADASIRLPVSRPELALALGAAVTNHRFVRSRLEASQLDFSPVSALNTSPSIIESERAVCIRH